MNLNSEDTEQLKEKQLWVKNYFLSIVIHLIMILVLVYLLSLSSKTSRINSVMFSLDTKEYLTEKSIKPKQDFENQENVKNPSTQNDEDLEEEIKAVSFSEINADTTNLDQVYSESTLNISIKYPKGWTFIDQNNKNKLDGVTFWASEGEIFPPPYIHLEVVDKELFIEKRYKYKLDLDNFTVFYNDPEEMQDFLTQIFYLRTDKDEDFKLKLMIKGKSEFEAFLPKFWGILKSFKIDTLFF